MTCVIVRTSVNFVGIFEMDFATNGWSSLELDKKKFRDGYYVRDKKLVGGTWSRID